jgi:hypothetical protein
MLSLLFVLINAGCIFVSSFFAYVGYRQGRIGVMWLNIGAVGINVIAVAIGLFNFFTFLSA